MQQTVIAISFAIVSLSHHAILAEEPTRLTIGAIRWDAWFNGNTYESNLAPKRWHSRLPFYAFIATDGTVTIRSDGQKVMDEEIAVASKAKLDYWAFCYYHPKSWDGADNYNYGWKLYLSSKQKAQMHFCLLLQGTHLGPDSEWPETVQTLVRLLKETTYQTVLDGRPLLFVYSVLEMKKWAGSSEAAKQRLDDLRKECQKSGLKNPYLVAQVYRTKDGIEAVDALGFDAISAYSLPGGSGDQEFPFRELAKSNSDFWSACKATGKPVVPIVNTGWDNRPRRTEAKGKIGDTHPAVASWENGDGLIRSRRLGWQLGIGNSGWVSPFALLNQLPLPWKSLLARL